MIGASEVCIAAVADFPTAIERDSDIRLPYLRLMKTIATRELGDRGGVDSALEEYDDTEFKTAWGRLRDTHIELKGA